MRHSSRDEAAVPSLRPLLPAIALAAAGAMPLSGRVLLSARDGWAAFRDASPRRCFAVTGPVRGPHPRGWSPYLAIGWWPGHGITPQVQLRLSRTPADGAPVTLAIGDARFTLLAAGADAWAPDAAADRAIVSAMRDAPSLSVESRAAGGAPFADGYRLAGAPTAIDAAGVGCSGQG